MAQDNDSTRRRPLTDDASPNLPRSTTAGRRPSRMWIMPIAVTIIVVAALIVWALVGGSANAPTDPVASEPTASGPTASAPGMDGRVAVLVPRVIAEYPHDPTAFTQGLLMHQGRLYESTGLRGASSLREVDLASGKVGRLVKLDDRFFGEGLALVGNDLWQITWQSGVALRYDHRTFEQIDTASYDGEGWGLCFDGQRLVMSDGSDRLTFRNPTTFEATGTIDVKRDGMPQTRLNELECVGDLVYANVWQTNDVVEIDPVTGRVTAVVDASSLTSRALEEATSDMDVLNGIAWDPDSGHFYLTGKWWPLLFEVTFEPIGQGG